MGRVYRPSCDATSAGRIVRTVARARPTRSGVADRHHPARMMTPLRRWPSIAPMLRPAGVWGIPARPPAWGLSLAIRWSTRGRPTRSAASAGRGKYLGATTMGSTGGVLKDVWTIFDGLPLLYRTNAASPPDDARTIVHIHGFAISGRYLLPTASLLARRYATFVPDLPGFGRSHHPAKPLYDRSARRCRRRASWTSRRSSAPCCWATRSAARSSVRCWTSTSIGSRRWSSSHPPGSLQPAGLPGCRPDGPGRPSRAAPDVPDRPDRLRPVRRDPLDRPALVDAPLPDGPAAARAGDPGPGGARVARPAGQRVLGDRARRRASTRRGGGHRRRRPRDRRLAPRCHVVALLEVGPSRRTRRRKVASACSHTATT